MNKTLAIQYIQNTMNLRKPQVKSLVIFADYLESSSGKAYLHLMRKSQRPDVREVELNTKEYFATKVESKTFEGFDSRAFPSFTFALATGVGKTRLMGAFVAYLYFVHNVQHFLIVSPGNTIYKKLLDDFSKSNSSKYVFKGFEELNSSTIKIVTKDNYQNSSIQGLDLYKNKIEINILNIQQFAQRDAEKGKGITKFSEMLGESYFDYLSSLDDLTVMLDESHHYHADAAFDSLDRMGPLLGLEFTATPYTGETVGRGKQKTQEKKKNIIYGYNLGDAIQDGYVKTPWIGTEADVNFSQFETDDINTDMRKMQLGAHFHERAKVAIQEYASKNDVRVVKPVMLVVAKDTTHAKELRINIDSDNFCYGMYKGKVIEVHTAIKGEESEETIQQLISLEEDYNKIEVVIHVNMLKEGWDVANIYTIVPLRSSTAEILTEQTIGRGLRLPYGERTGVDLVDRVMIVAHEKYADIIAKAKDSTLIQPTNIEQVNADEVKVTKEFIQVKPNTIQNIENEIKQNHALLEEISKQVEKEVITKSGTHPDETVVNLEVAEKIAEKVEEIAKTVSEGASFSTFHNQNISSLNSFDTGGIFAAMSTSSQEALKVISEKSAKTLELRNIPIPRVTITPHFENIYFEHFTLDSKEFAKYSTHTTILEQELQGKKGENLFGKEDTVTRKVETSRVASFSGRNNQSAESTVIAGLLDYPLIDYDDELQRPVLLDLAKQTVSFYRNYIKDEGVVKNIIEINIQEISGKIYNQMVTSHKKEEGEYFEESEIREPLSYLGNYNLTREINEKIVSLESQINTFSKLRLYGNFKKACHAIYRFDSSDEARLAYLFERDNDVEDWLRPAPKQFDGLYWKNEKGEEHRYEPDFVIELENEITMIEVKPQSEIDSRDVQEKKKTANKYCDLISKNIGKYGIVKNWRYVIIPAEKITVSSSVEGLLR